MTFTDEDLKRLKENATKREGMLSTVCTVDATEVKALLTRLKVAEVYIVNHHKYCQPPPCDDYVRWRKAIGKQ